MQSDLDPSDIQTETNRIDHELSCTRRESDFDQVTLLSIAEEVVRQMLESRVLEHSSSG